MARNKYPEETVKRILDVSLQLFLEKGYEHTSIQDIIDHLGGLSKGAIYHHFKSKEEIMIAVMDRLYSYDPKWDDVMQNGAMTGLEKLREMVRLSVNNPAQRDVFSTAPNMLENSKMLTMQMQGIMEEAVPRYIQPIIEQGVADGSIKTAYPREMAESVLLLLNLWLNPMVFYADTETMLKRFAFAGDLFKGVGLDILNHDIIERLIEYYDLYGANKK
ncbi:MAG: TetR/AcrR family transcriptional regulator [Oscillospiraceae bacterium]|nr:TetR/AcrR family transcriptional regulator [Oscillospiraceae bacterium]